MKRYTVRVVILMTLYAAALVGVNLWFRHEPPRGPVAYAAAILPALPIIGVFVVYARLLVELTDEYVRMLLVRQSLVATAFALSICTAWGFLEAFGLVRHVEAYFAAVLWCAGLGVGGCVNFVAERRATR
jgi:hypothetical protein